MIQSKYAYKPTGFLALAVLLSAMGCQQSGTSGRNSVISGNLTTASQSDAHRKIGDENGEFSIYGQKALTTGIKQKKILTADSAQGKLALDSLVTRNAEVGSTNNEPPTSETGTDPATPPAPAKLTVGYPVGLLGEHLVFGGVITKVSDTNSENLGALKLTDLTPLHAQTAVAKDPMGAYFLALTGCVNKCNEASEAVDLLYVPIVGVDTANSEVLVDFAALGTELNLIGMLDPDGAYTKLKTKWSSTTAVDFSVSTLVFDVETGMIPVDTAADAIATAPETKFTVRWYLRLGSVFNPAFEPRPATNGVGFFMTERSAQSKIHRHSLSEIHYFIKDVPTQFRPAFAAAFDEWNTQFTNVIGKKLIRYEFVETTDPRYALLVPGDVRFNIVEWDMVNNAPYGGLGPSIANQYTGEILTSNVLIQGPRIVEIYKKWFGIVSEADNLRANGHVEEADALLTEGKKEIEAMVPKKQNFSLKLGKHLAFRVTSQLPSLEDPLFAMEGFDEIPSGVTFESYMQGYFQEMVAHELGHNVGLRHNFRGNLSSKPGVTLGGVSHSIMEYLGRGFRHMNRIGDYDTMAIQYGYAGTTPTKLGMFCTDDDVPSEANPKGSAECSKEDATADPFSFLESRLKRSIDLLVNRGTALAPAWKVADMETQLASAVKGLGYYASTAADTGAKWTNFFIGGERPATPAEVKGYVLKKVKAQICDPDFAQVMASKENDAAKQATLDNIAALRAKTVELVSPLGAFGATELACN